MTSAGIGFIQRDDGEADVFVHAKYLADVFRPAEGQRVSFSIARRMTGADVAALIAFGWKPDDKGV